MLRVNGVQVFALPIGPPLTTFEWAKYYAQLPPDEQIRILQYQQWHDRQRALLGSIISRWAIQQLTATQEVQIVRNKYGRPYVIGDVGWRGDFNLSHSGDWLVIAVTENGHVGIDVEEIKPVTIDVMHYAMTENEITSIDEIVEPLRLKKFYELWTLKEALFKTALCPQPSPHLIDTTDEIQNISTQLIYLDERHPVSICWDRTSHINLTFLNRHQLL
ncbi:4'-phosphopantetheinyl transferase family protein [Lysinibacillus sp. NPDC097162]|uniref:4'-phosphopantetheinyl transferase family protein n=1 Tax=Lysinibacillus sp. NPDC097162 TaxID=3364140 RepID=UPI00382B9CE8